MSNITQFPQRGTHRRDGQHHAILQQLPIGVLWVDTEHRYQYANDKWCKLLQCSIHTLSTKEWFFVIDGVDPSIVQDQLNRACGRDESPITLEVVNAVGQYIQLQINNAPTTDLPAGYVITAWDITDQRSKDQHLYNMAYKDQLTGLYNRAYFDKQIRVYLDFQKLNPEHPAFAIGMFDLDNFKSVNDQIGHDAGDELLVQIANRLTSSFSDHPVTIARWGGDEFIVMWMQQTRRHGDISLHMEIESKLSKMFKNPNRNSYTVGPDCTPINVSMSVGFAVCDQNIMTPLDLFRKMDRAMYHTKTKGKDNYTVV